MKRVPPPLKQNKLGLCVSVWRQKGDDSLCASGIGGNMGDDEWATKSVLISLGAAAGVNMRCSHCREPVCSCTRERSVFLR